ncbi:MAG: Nif3-like dinuclear metal center hexameric protein [Burkholderiales bacterium]|nr:Nif3-like dinuclear metal center hexameric protein [Burkholderiales bacterium]
MERAVLEAYLADYLQVPDFRDYCPNGLQVEGRADVRCIVTGVTASSALIEAAVAAGADALLVHHGYFWRGEDGRITGMRRRRITALLEHDLNLFAYHLPLDVHPEVGNNAQLALRLGMMPAGRFGEQDIGVHGRLREETTLAGFGERIEQETARRPLLIGDPARPLRRVAWCTGGAQGLFEQAIALGVDAYVSGEISEQTVHAARESGVAYVAAGHHATERYGVQALGEHLARHFGLRHRFIDIDNPV